MKFRIYTAMDPEYDKLYLESNGDDLVIDADDEQDAITKAINFVYDTSRYSTERTAYWLDSNKLYCEQVEPTFSFTL